MQDAAYLKRRGEIQTYFDRTAVEAWKRFATEAPLGRIRESVRQGRTRMRAAMLAFLPEDLSGWRLLDAGCGAGDMAVALARRGADVTAVDLSPEIVRFAADRSPRDLGPGRIDFAAGDMLAPGLGRFDAIMAMDSLIHYRSPDAVAALESLSRRTERTIVFTFAPRTALLSLMHATGRLFPRADRAPSIEPALPAAMRRRLGAALPPGWDVGGSVRIGSGFYISQAMELRRS